MKRVVFILILIVVSLVNAQQKWLISDNIINGIPTKPKSVINTVDDKSGYFVSFFKSKKTSRAQLFDEKQKLLSTIDIENDFLDRYQYLGSSTSAQNYTMLFQKFKYKFAILKLDFKTENSEFIEILEIDDEQIIESFKYEGDLYVLTVIKNTSKLKLYHLDILGGFESKEIDFSNESFVKRNGLETTLFHLITNKDSKTNVNSAIVENNAPISLEIASAINKVYFNNGVIIISNDNNVNQTYIINIDIENNKHSCKTIDKRGFLREELRSESNSFILEGYFFSNYVTTSKMVFAVYDLKNSSLIKEFKVSNRDFIQFKNTEFIASKNGKSQNAFLNTRRFLKKIVNSNSGVSVRKIERGYVVSIGASEKFSQQYFATIGFYLGGIPVSAILSAFDTYTSTRSTRIDCLFDSNFNHIEGGIEQNKFDRINGFKRVKKIKKAPLETIFKYKDEYVWGFYSKATGLYRYYIF